MHYYVFYYTSTSPFPHYERTCGDMDRAIGRCKELNKRTSVTRSTWMKDKLPLRYWY